MEGRNIGLKLKTEEETGANERSCYGLFLSVLQLCYCILEELLLFQVLQILVWIIIL